MYRYNLMTFTWPPSSNKTRIAYLTTREDARMETFLLPRRYVRMQKTEYLCLHHRCPFSGRALPHSAPLLKLSSLKRLLSLKCSKFSLFLVSAREVSHVKYLLVPTY